MKMPADDSSKPQRRSRSKSAPFSGSVLIDVEITILGVRSKRVGRVNYECSPAWEHCDEDGHLRPPNGSISLSLDLLVHDTRIVHSSTKGRPRSQEIKRWKRSDLMRIGHVDDRAWHRVEALIEEEMRAEDARRRQHCGHPQGKYPWAAQGVAQAP